MTKERDENCGKLCLTASWKIEAKKIHYCFSVNHDVKRYQEESEKWILVRSFFREVSLRQLDLWVRHWSEEEERKREREKLKM